jgi:hypothetical protein
LAFLGLNEEETHVAGLAMVVLAGVPPVILAVAGELGELSTTLVALPVLVTGVLYLWSAALRHREDALASDDGIRELLPAV